jgi:Zn-dependent protease with chaperone function
MANNVYDFQASNIRRTWIMFAVFFIVVVGIGYVFSEAYGDPSFIIFAVIFTVIYSLISYYSSAKIALSMARAQEIQKPTIRCCGISSRIFASRMACRCRSFT